MKTSELYQIFLQHPNVTTDSRKIEPGSIFFALKGENFNGNKFAAGALEKGAAYSVIDEPEFKTGDQFILVDDVLTSLQELATYHRQQLKLQIIAITGTNGKTTTKELTSAILSKKYRVVNTKGNLNNHIGVPLTLLSLNQDTELGIIEMGANHPGEIRQLCEIALPDYGLITNVGKAHLEGFGSFEGVINTKTEMYRFLEKNNGKVFINTANPYLSDKTGTASKIRYTTQKGLEGLEGELIQSSPFMVFKARFPKGWLYCKTQLVGGYNLENALAAATIGQYFGVDPLKIQEALEEYTPANNRSQFIKTANNSLLMDAYNANPTSMAAALDNFSHYDAPRKAVFLGDMLELGESSREEHQKIVDIIRKMNIDQVFLVGNQFSGCQHDEGYHLFTDNTQLIEHLNKIEIKDCLILIKGSRGMKLETIAEKL
jgi:UDP-N-acetylmuramoyl-tripeptide--D-alanyl-D-alanine ligase